MEESGAKSGSGKREGERQFIEMVFSKSSGVLSSVDHEKIIAAAQETEQSASEKYAMQVAENARSTILKSVEIMKMAPVGTVTWTGKNGTGGLLRSGHLSGASLLNNMKSRDHSSASGDSDPEGNAIFGRLKQWLQKKGGRVTTEQLKLAGQELQISESKRRKFKKALTKLTMKDRENHLFTLKPEFFGV